MASLHMGRARAGNLPVARRTSFCELAGQVMVTALLSISLLGESLSLHQIVVGVVVLAGIYLANQKPKRNPEKAPQAANVASAIEA